MLRQIRCAAILALVAVAACKPSNRGGGGGGDDDSDVGPGPGPAADAPFFLPTGEPDNTAAPIVEVDAGGGIHAVYPAYAGGRAYYAFCGDGCSDPQDMSVVRFDTEGTVLNAMLRLDAQGRPRVLISSSYAVTFASCDAGCADPAAWTLTTVVEHDGYKDVTGEAFALDPSGRPRFLMHTDVAYLGIGQKPPATHWVACDDACHDPASWSVNQISTEIWQSSHLRYDAAGKAHVATSVMTTDETGSTVDVAAYASCAGDCSIGEAWFGQGIAPAFSSTVDAVPMPPAVALALTSDGRPRIVAMSKNEFGKRNIAYFACDADCETAPWAGTILVDGDGITAGLDLALDANDHPRFVLAHDYNIGIASCDADRCETAESPWTISKVENGSEMSPDEIYLWENCTVGAWFLHSPSLALDATGAPRAGYQARDISGGFENPDPDELHDCVAGTDMTWSRMALLPGVD